MAGEVTDAVADKRFLVTGAAGFIGNHLVRTLAAHGAREVRALDREPLAANPFFVPAPGVTEIRLTLGDASTEALGDALDGVDAVFHLAAVKYRPRGEPLVDIVRTNALGTAALLEAATRAGVAKLVFTSSLYAYGRMRGGPLDEAETPAPCTAYGCSKRFGEELLALAGVRFTTLRYLFVYGPGQAPKHGYPSVIVKSFVRMLAGRPPIIYGDGAQVLDYVFVDDVVAATIRALAPEADGRVYNVGSGKGTAIRDLIGTMRDLAGFSGEPEFQPPDGTAGTSRVARIDRIRSDLGWSPRTPLRDGLAATLTSIRLHPGWYGREK